MLTTLINNLKKYNKVWIRFNPKDIQYEYKEFFTDIDKFLKENNIYIVHGYNHESLLLEYIIYYKGEIIDLFSEKNEFINPYWDIIIECFKYLENE